MILQYYMWQLLVRIVREFLFIEKKVKNSRCLDEYKKITISRTTLIIIVLQSGTVFPILFQG